MGNSPSRASSRKRQHVDFLRIDETIVKIEDMKGILSQFPVSEFRSSHRRPLLITDVMRDVYTSVTVNETSTHCLQGASGVGKTMTLLFIGHMAQKCGCLVFSIRGHEMLFGTTGQEVNPKDVQLSVSQILTRWMNTMGVSYLSEFECPCQKQMTILQLVKLGAEDPSKSISTLKSLIWNLAGITRVPVVILIDQCNAFYAPNIGKNDPLGEVGDICAFFAGIGNKVMARGSLLLAFSSSFKLMPLAKDGDSILFIEIAPMEIETFTSFVENLVQSFETKLIINTKELFKICGGLPREAVAIFLTIDQNKNADLNAIRIRYFENRTKFYLYRIQKLVQDLKADCSFRKESIEFACQLFIGARMHSVPQIWKEAGMIVLNGDDFRLPCQAAEMALTEYFDESATKSAIDLYRSDRSVSWRALELAFVYVIRKLISVGAPVEFDCTDLQGKNPSMLQLRVERIQYCEKLPEESSIHLGTLFVCPRGHPVVDFFLYGQDGAQVFVQASESEYARHSSKYEDLAPLINIYQKALVPAPIKSSTMQYVYLTTSDKLMKTSQHFHPQVLLISNAGGQQRASKLLRNLI